MNLPLIHGLLKEELSIALHELGQPVFRTDQVWSWLYRRAVSDWSRMRNLPRAFRDDLAARFSPDPVQHLETAGTPGKTRKLLLELRDGERVETVLIPAGPRRTVCVSSQAGCRYHCAFCASGQDGFRRNLEAGEIVGQVLSAAREWDDRPTHVVFMGIGEPLDNYDAVMKAIRIVNEGSGLAIGARRITISTCGLVPGIDRLAGEGMQFELSVSLHAADDETRTRLMPVNRKIGIAALLDACNRYARASGRIITFEYTLIDGVNASSRQARDLARILSPLPCRVNLIPLNTVDEFDGTPASRHAATEFRRILEEAGINTTLRASKGASLAAACGQLRAGQRPTSPR
ncbi:MAG: 23S rRNA (adenine(2503)-C(2))-methyltransferase RlmN [Lentisphaerae bacterium]|nr:23S rRNA (adenine(2503)-C(2))-methyltransferase RlmN [Lentisphaerota bacterium]